MIRPLKTKGAEGITDSAIGEKLHREKKKRDWFHQG